MASVLKRGGFWYAKWTDATGKRCRERIDASSKAQAKARADELAVEARRHRNLARRARNGLPPRPEDLTGTFADLCTWWLDHRCPEASRSGERQRLGKYVVSKPVGALPLAALGSPHLDELLHNAESAGASAASVNKLRSVLHTVFSKAKKAGRWVGENPVASTERRKVARRIYATLRAEEVPLLLAEVPADWRPLFAAALWTGMRRGELFALRKSDVDLSLGTIMVARSNERQTTKGGHADLIPIAAPLFPILKYQLEHAPGSLVFPAEDGSQRSPESHLSPIWVKIGAKRAPHPVPRPKMVPPTPHTLRTFLGGRCRIRTRDPCRVNARHRDGRGYPPPASPCIHEGHTSAHHCTD